MGKAIIFSGLMLLALPASAQPTCWFNGYAIKCGAIYQPRYWERERHEDRGWHEERHEERERHEHREHR